MLSSEIGCRQDKTGESYADRLAEPVVEVKEEASTFEPPPGYFPVTTRSRGLLSRTREGREATKVLTEFSNVLTF
jgi:hypothetical protein